MSSPPCGGMRWLVPSVVFKGVMFLLITVVALLRGEAAAAEADRRAIRQAEAQVCTLGENVRMSNPALTVAIIVPVKRERCREQMRAQDSTKSFQLGISGPVPPLFLGCLSKDILIVSSSLGRPVPAPRRGTTSSEVWNHPRHG